MAIKQNVWDVEGLEKYDCEWEYPNRYNQEGYGSLKEYEVKFLEMKKNKHKKNRANSGRVVHADFNLEVFKPPNARL